jgi:hypothetical protein
VKSKKDGSAVFIQHYLNQNPTVHLILNKIIFHYNV